MTTRRWCIFALIFAVCSMVLATGEADVKPKTQNIERSPRPNSDISEVQALLSSAWLDTVDEWFKEMIEKGKDALIQLGKTGVHVLDHIVDFVPKPESVFQAAKDVFFALPQEVVVYAIDAYCNLASHVDALTPFMPDKREMHIEFVTEGLELTIKMDSPEAICDHPKFVKGLPTVIVTTGWLSNINSTSEALEGLYKAYSKRKVNFMFFDTARYIDTLYSWSAFNTKALGQFLGEALVSLQKCVDPNNLHLIGHSLGAHISGYAARQFHCSTDKLISRVTGLDPADPCFREGEALSGLRRGDASFVDIIHSNCGVLGRRSPLGDVDFYPNGRHPLQPGCFTITCSHSRSWELFAETVIPGNEQNLMATRCDSYSSLKAGHCGGKPIPMGYAVPTTSKGDYFLETNRESPYGMRIQVTTTTDYDSCMSF